MEVEEQGVQEEARVQPCDEWEVLGQGEDWTSVNDFCDDACEDDIDGPVYAECAEGLYHCDSIGKQVEANQVDVDDELLAAFDEGLGFTISDFSDDGSESDIERDDEVRVQAEVKTESGTRRAVLDTGARMFGLTS
jgi:hypothetical protein